MLSKSEVSRNKLQIPVLLGAIEEFQFDCAIGGARRDEEKARAKERFFSFRDHFGQWDPKNQRPEIWNLYNAKVNPGENMRGSRSPTGRRWTSGNTSKRRSSKCRTFTSATSANASVAAANGCQCRRHTRTRPSPILLTAHAPKANEPIKKNDRPRAHDCGHDQHRHD